MMHHYGYSACLQINALCISPGPFVLPLRGGGGGGGGVDTRVSHLGVTKEASVHFVHPNCS